MRGNNVRLHEPGTLRPFNGRSFERGGEWESCCRLGYREDPFGVPCNTPPVAWRPPSQPQSIPQPPSAECRPSGGGLGPSMRSRGRAAASGGARAFVTAAGDPSPTPGGSSQAARWAPAGRLLSRTPSPPWGSFGEALGTAHGQPIPLPGGGIQPRTSGRVSRQPSRPPPRDRQEKPSAGPTARPPPRIRRAPGRPPPATPAPRRTAPSAPSHGRRPFAQWSGGMWFRQPPAVPMLVR